MRLIASVSAMCLVVAVALFWPCTSASYDFYNGTPGCDDCHPGFIGKGPLHKDVHVGNQNMTGNCDLCHTTNGDNPNTSSSAEGMSCIGCHQAEGLRLHHANAGAPPDQFGLFCVSCHPNDGMPLPESAKPPYYVRADVNVMDPCLVARPEGEDYDGDGQGLDNDGDLIYDQGDPDCVQVPTEQTTWSRIKALYGN